MLQLRLWEYERDDVRVLVRENFEAILDNWDDHITLDDFIERIGEIYDNARARAIREAADSPVTPSS